MSGMQEVAMEQQMVCEAQIMNQASAQPSYSANCEAIWIQGAQQGDLSGFNQLVLAHQDGVFRWVVSLVYDDMLAEDITQWTFVTAFEKLSTFRGGSFRAWLFRIARNRSFDEMRRRKNHAAVSLDDSTDSDHDRLEVLPDGSPLPEEELIKIEQAAMIENLLSRLPETFQQTLRLIDMEGMDYQEAADVLGLPLGTVKSRLARARLKIRDSFQKTVQQEDLFLYRWQS